MATIRPATDADVPALLALGQRFLAWSPYAGMFGEDAMAKAIAEAVATGFSRVAVVDGVAVGALLGALKPAWLDPSFVVACELAWWVEPEHRGGTAAVRMLHEFKAWAKDQGARGVVMAELVQPDSPAFDLFQRLGFRMAERFHYCEV